MQSDDQAFMGGDINWRPHEYMHTEGLGKHDPHSVTEATKIDYRTYAQRCTARDDAIWEAWPQLAVSFSDNATGRGHEAQLELSF